MSPQEADIDTAKDATDSEVVRYEKAFLATRRVLNEVIRSLSVQLELEDDSDRRDQLSEKITELEGELSDLSRANIAFHAHTATMVPPSSGLVNELTDLANSSTQLTQQRATAAASLRIATQALNKFAAIQKTGD